MNIIMSGGGKMNRPMAQLLQSAICKTNSKFRPNPSVFYFPGLTSAPVWSSSHIDASQTNIPANFLKKIKVIEDAFTPHHVAMLKEYQTLRSSLGHIASSDFDTSKVRLKL